MSNNFHSNEFLHSLCISILCIGILLMKTDDGGCAAEREV